jgi:protein-disulfide isomerase
MEELPPTSPIEDTPPRSSALPWIGLVLLAFALGLGAGYFIWARPLQARVVAAEEKVASFEKSAKAQSTAQAGQAQAPVEVEIPEDIKRFAIPEDDDPVFGSANAPITIIEFSDYECPFCRRWHQEVWPQLKANYGDQIRLVYRDFPLYNIHPNAIAAAEAANCAGDQDRYWEFSDMLYEADGLSPDLYVAFAQQLKLDMDQFNQCVQEETYKPEVEADLSYASELGVRSTPTFFINGLYVVGAQPYEVFQQIIDLELAGKIPK